MLHSSPGHCSDPGFCPRSCAPSAALRARSPGCHLCPSRGVRVTDPAWLCLCPGACGAGSCKAPGWEPAGSARPRLPCAASCAINDKAAAELCLCAGSLCVSQVWLGLSHLPGWGLCRAGGLQGINGSWSSALGSQIHGFCPCLLCVSDCPTVSPGSQPPASPRAAWSLPGVTGPPALSPGRGSCDSSDNISARVRHRDS